MQAKLSLKSDTSLKIILAAITIILYLPILGNGFSKLDDGWVLYHNKHVFNLSCANISGYFSSFYYGQYSPLITLIYGLIYGIFGLSPFWYHLFSLLLHTANVLVVFYFIKYLLSLSEKFNGKLQIPANRHSTIAFIATLFFAIHPIQVEAVAWIAASKILLYAFLFLWSLICYLRFIETGKWYNYLLSLTLFLVSFGAKEQTLILPCSLLAIDYFLHRDLKCKKVIIEKLPFFMLALVLGYIEVKATSESYHNLMAMYYYPLGQRIVFANFSLIKYLVKLLVPFKLARFYPFPMVSGSPLPVVYYVYPVCVIALLAYLYRCYKANKRYIVFGASFFIFNLSLALDIIPMARKSVMADRYVYLSIIGLFFTLATLGLDFFDGISSGRQKIVLVSFGAYIFYLMAYTVCYSQGWG